MEDKEEYNFINTDYFMSDDAIIIDDSPKKNKKNRSVEKIDDAVIIRDQQQNNNNNPGSAVIDANYAKSYNETNNLIKTTIVQTDELCSEIKEDLDVLRNNKTLKNKYTYITNMSSTISALLGTKIMAIRELNSSITQAHNLELNRLKALKLNEDKQNDEMKMMDIYSAFVNAPVGSYNPNVPAIADLNSNGGTKAIEMSASGSSNGYLTPEQVRMRMEQNPNIRTVVKYNQSTGARYFDVVDSSTGESIPNYPRPDEFLLEDTTIDVASGIARNRNVNEVWPLVLEGSSSIEEY